MIQKINLKDILVYTVVSFVILGFIYFGSIEIFFNNYKEYGYNFIAFFKNIFPEYILYSLGIMFITYILSLLNSKVKKIIEIVFIIILILELLNLAFFPVNALLDGRENVNVLSKQGIINILLSVMVIVLTIIIYITSQNKRKLLIFVSLICSVYILFNTTLSIINSSYKPKLSTSAQISTLPEDVLKLSNEKNIIYIVLDQFDTSYFEKILNENDALWYKMAFKDFTYFKNYAGAHPTTIFSGVASMGGKPYDNSMPYKEFREKVFSEGYSLFEKLQYDGYDNIVYYKHKNSSVIYAPAELYSNKIYKSYNNAPKNEGIRYLQASIYRTMPYFLRNKIKITVATSDKNNWDFKFLEMINNNGIIINDKNTFMLLHLEGAHDPHVINENMEFDKNADSTSQSKASLKLTKLFLEKIKDTSEELYNNSVIIITTDHGYWKPNAICLVKPLQAQNDTMQIDNRPLSQIYMKDFIYDLQNNKKLSDIEINYKRYFYDYDYILALDNGYFSNIYMYELPDILYNEKKYDLIKVYKAPSGVINEKKIEIQFPNDYENLPQGVELGSGWKNTSNGLLAEDTYKIINFILDENIRKSVNIEVDYECEGGCYGTYLHVRTYDRDKKDRVRYGGFDLNNKDRITYNFDAENDFILQFDIKDKLIIKKITLDIK